MSEDVCVNAGEQPCLQISIAFTGIMLFSALLGLEVPKNLNWCFEEGIGNLRI